MVIQPNSTIKIYNNIPLNPAYEHTIYFANVSAQNAYFHAVNPAKAKYTLTNQTYQRVNKKSMRIEKRAEDLCDCNYLAFQNTAFGNKWFYAFITSVEYVNNEVSEITYEIDLIQTYWFDIEFKYCFVEREHALTDDIGDNIEPEPVDTGELVFSNYDRIAGFAWASMCVIVAISDAEGETTSGSLYDGIYGGADLWAYRANDTEAINTLLTNYLQAPESVVSMYMCPEFLIGTVPEGGLHIPSTSSAKSFNVALDVITTTDTFEGYTPKNHKLYTYPYNYLSIDNAGGQSLPLRYEFFENLRPRLALRGSITQPVKILCRPYNYKHSKHYDSSTLGVMTPVTTESITLENYPMCSWNIDTFSAWVAQNAIPVAINSGVQLFDAGYKANNSTSAPPIQNTAISMTANILTQAYTKSIASDNIRGNIASGNVNVSSDTQAFYAGRLHVCNQKAKIIDEFFSRFGYATNRLKIPNIYLIKGGQTTTRRKQWIYEKTQNCCIYGHAPADDIRKIEDIFNNGITFWFTPANVGNFSLDNGIQ